MTEKHTTNPSKYRSQAKSVVLAQCLRMVASTSFVGVQSERPLVQMHETLVVHHRHAWRCLRTDAALSSAHGVQVLTIEQLAARLAGGFLRPIDPDAFKTAIGAALEQPIGELDVIKRLPGFQRAVVSTFAKAWSAGLNLSQESESATDKKIKSRLSCLSELEQAALGQLPKNQLRSQALVNAATKRATFAPAIFGRIEIRGFTEMSPVWRPLLSVLAKEMEVVWVAEARQVPDWLSATEIVVKRTQPAKPVARTVSCASPRHEILEAFRWARQHLAHGVASQDIAIAAAAPDEWDDHVLSLAQSANLPIHFVHGVAALSTPEGQLAAALAEVLLRGFSRRRIVRFVALLRSQTTRFHELPSNWSHVLPDDAPLLDAARWVRLIESLKPADFSGTTDHQSILLEIIHTLKKGLAEAAEIGEILLEGKPLLVWRKALMEGPPAALDVTLTGLRTDDGQEPEAAVVWTPASALASMPRPYVWLVGLTSRTWPRHASEDPILPDHVIAADRLEPLRVHQADRRDFVTIRDMTDRELVCSRARRDCGGRLYGISPLYPRDLTEDYFTQSREPAHAASSSDRLLARPDEFAGLSLSVSAAQAWNNWHQMSITDHDGLVRANHPVLLRALDRQQSATSLVKLLRDPLGYLWTYGFHWSEPGETDEPLTLDSLSFGSLLHEILDQAVTQIECARPSGFAGASSEEIGAVLKVVVQKVDTQWKEDRPIPPPVIWKRKLMEAADLALVALSFHDDPYPGERSWSEIPFGGDQKATSLTEEARARLPWDPFEPVIIPGTTIRIAGSIDRLDISGDGSRARVTDYKSGTLRSAPPQLKGGAELQRCLYAYAVKALITQHPDVEAQLLFPRRDGRGLRLANPDGTLARLTSYLNAATTSFSGGAALPGPATNERWYDLAFALPGGAKETYLTAKLPLAAELLAGIAPLWGEP